MGSPADHRSSFARSLSSIHLRQNALLVSSDDSDGSDGKISHKKRDRPGTVNRSTIILRCNLRSGIASSATPSQTSTAVTPPLLGDRDCPTLQQAKRVSSLHRPADNFQRRSDFKKLRRRTAVTFAPQLSTFFTKEEQIAEGQQKVFHQEYELGETLRSTSDMIIEPTSEQAVQAVESLQKHDFAFVKRSDGTYSYAILASRSDESLTFVVCTGGSIKIMAKRHWSESVRLVSREGTSRYINKSI